MKTIAEYWWTIKGTGSWEGAAGTLKFTEFADDGDYEFTTSAEAGIEWIIWVGLIRLFG